MASSKHRRAVGLPVWLHTKLAGQAEQLGVTTAAYTARLLEEATGLRDRPFAWRHVARQGESKVV